jgi:hypothetical protein
VREESLRRAGKTLLAAEDALVAQEAASAARVSELQAAMQAAAAAAAEAAAQLGSEADELRVQLRDAEAVGAAHGLRR